LADSVKAETAKQTQALRAELDVKREAMEELQSTRVAEVDFAWWLLGQLDSSLSWLGLPPVRPAAAPASVMEADPILEAAGVNLWDLGLAVSEVLDSEE
jgi:hypothetical protein